MTLNLIGVRMLYSGFNFWTFSGNNIFGIVFKTKTYFTVSSSKKLQAAAVVTIDEIWNLAWSDLSKWLGWSVSRNVIWVMFWSWKNNCYFVKLTCAVGAIETRIRIAFVFIWFFYWLIFKATKTFKTNPSFHHKRNLPSQDHRCIHTHSH